MKFMSKNINKCETRIYINKKIVNEENNINLIES